MARLYGLARRGELDIVIIYSRNHRTVLFWSRFLHLIGVPVALELCEWPLAISSANNRDNDKAWAFCHKALLAVDGIIPISSYIEQEALGIASAAGKTLPSFRIPILMDAREEEP